MKTFKNKLHKEKIPLYNIKSSFKDYGYIIKKRLSSLKEKSFTFDKKNIKIMN